MTVPAPVSAPSTARASSPGAGPDVLTLPAVPAMSPARSTSSSRYWLAVDGYPHGHHGHTVVPGQLSRQRARTVRYDPDAQNLAPVRSAAIGSEARLGAGTGAGSASAFGAATGTAAAGVGLSRSNKRRHR